MYVPTQKKDSRENRLILMAALKRCTAMRMCRTKKTLLSTAVEKFSIFKGRKCGAATGRSRVYA
jgi:hypothetical protein